MESKKREVPLKLNIGFGIGEISDMVAYQGFSFLVFTFYYTVVKLPLSSITLVYILWSIYDAINDPVLGALSDRTRTTRFGGGRRRPWIVMTTIPLGLIMLFLFTPPTTSTIASTIYFFIILCLFDTIYTAYGLNHTALYPEMFVTDREREEAGAGRRIIMVIGLIIAFVLPGFIIEDMANVYDFDYTITEYQITGSVFGVIVVISLLIHLKYGVKEPPLEKIQAQAQTSFKDSIKLTLKNKNFMTFVFPSMMNWYVFALMPMIISIYATHVLGVDRDSIMISALLLVAFLCSIPGVLFWSKLDAKIGSKRGLTICMACWALSFIPFAFITSYSTAMIMMTLVGFCLGGAPFYIDKNISHITDEDEVEVGQRREGAYYGIHALIIRLSTILVILSISFVLSSEGWQVYNPEQTTTDLIRGLQLLMSVFPASALIIGIIILKWYKMSKEHAEDIANKRRSRILEEEKRDEHSIF